MTLRPGAPGKIGRKHAEYVYSGPGPMSENLRGINNRHTKDGRS